MLTREFELFLHCAKPVPRTKLSVTAIESCAESGLNWPRVADLGKRHGIMPLLLRSLRAACWDSVPGDVRSQLERFSGNNGRRNLVLASETLRVMSELRRNGIGAATFKGPVLTESVYGDLSLRRFVDIDVIVREPDIARTERLLKSFGYRTKGRDVTQRDYFDATGQYPYRHPDTGVNIDLHWELAPFGSAFPFTLAEMWSQIQDVPLAGHPVPTLAWEHMAMLLACHGTKERWRFLKWVCDFAFLIQARPELDWGAIFARAKQRHCSRPLLLGVLLASDLLDVLADAALLSRARSDRAVVALARESTLKMVRNKPDPDLDEFIYSLNSSDRLRDRISLIGRLSTTLTVSDYRSVPLPAGLRRLHYVARPFRLAGKVVRLLFARLAQRRKIGHNNW
jgi:hypothetical protein